MPNITLIYFVLIFAGIALGTWAAIEGFKALIKWASKRDVERLYKRISYDDTIMKKFDEADNYNDPDLDRDITTFEIFLILAMVVTCFVIGMVIKF